MKIALCLTGLLGGLEGRNGSGKTIDPRNGFYWYYKNLLKDNDVDVFFHTWGNQSEELIKLYSPKKYLFEEQIDFSKIDYEFYGCSDYEELFRKENTTLFKSFTDEDEANLKDIIYRSSSKWFSTHKSISLKKEYELENKFKYDFVVVTRFDIALTKKIDFSLLKKGILYLSERGQEQKTAKNAFNDLIFLGDSRIMDLFSTIYDLRNNYSVDAISSCYEHILRKKIKWESIFGYNKNTYILRWNQHLMRYYPQPYYFIRHSLREIKRKFLNV